MADISVHDNFVIAYEVMCEKREIVLHTEFRDRQPIERTDVVFSGVEAYHIIGDNMQSILFDVEECPLSHILSVYSSDFESGVRYAWPGAWNHSPQSCIDYFTTHNCKCWRIDSSFGMSGFVVAKEMLIRPAA